MTAFTTRKEFDAWTRHRLAEMDAGLAAMEAELARAHVSAASAAAMKEARAWRNHFAACIVLADHQDAEGHFRDAFAALKESWVHFETEMENWAVAAEQKNTAFDARAKALLGVWHAAAAGYKVQALAATAGQRALIDAAVARMEQDAARFGERIENLKDVGKLSWVAMGEALKDSRAAFERASDKAQEALSAAGKRH